MAAFFRRLLTEDRGQELVEYTLLVGMIALASIALIGAVQTATQGAYARWNTSIQRCWEMPDPGAGGGCP